MSCMNINEYSEYIQLWFNFVDMRMDLNVAQIIKFYFAYS